MRLLPRLLLIAGLLLPIGSHAHAADSPFEADLVRLAEILGSLHFLRNLCGETGDQWLNHMERLLDAENPDDIRRAKFVASFNSGYEAFAANYSRCTPSAVEAISRYMKEGESLSRETATRFGN